MRYLLSFTALIFFSISLYSAEIIGKVIKVADGDTITVLDDNNKKHKIRLAKIDAPELKQSYGIKSKNYLESLIYNKPIKVLYSSIDRYKRILGIVYLGDKEINLIMLKNGLAWHYYTDKTPSYIQAEKSARDKKIGLWSESNPINPYIFRRKQKKSLKKNDLRLKKSQHGCILSVSPGTGVFNQC